MIADAMNTTASTARQPGSDIPAFCEGMRHFGEPWPGFQRHAARAAIAESAQAIADPSDPDAVYQTLLMADALRYVTLQVCGSKGSGHPGGFASSAEAYAALVMLGHTDSTCCSRATRTPSRPPTSTPRTASTRAW